MPKAARAAGTQWGGLNKRSDPVDIPTEQSPDCANVFFYDQTLGLLGPRMGKAYAGALAYNIWGVQPWNIGGQTGALIAYGDSVSTEIDLLNPYPVTYPHGGWGDLARSGPAPGAVTNITRGFYVKWNGPDDTGDPGSDEIEDPDINVPIAGATKVTATLPSVSGVKVSALPVTIKTLLRFDGGGYEVANTCLINSSGCGTTMTVTETPSPVDCSGKTALTGIKCTVAQDGTVTGLKLSGEVYIVGTAATRESH